MFVHTCTHTSSVDDYFNSSSQNIALFLPLIQCFYISILCDLKGCKQSHAYVSAWFGICCRVVHCILQSSEIAYNASKPRQKPSESHCCSIGVQNLRLKRDCVHDVTTAYNEPSGSNIICCIQPSKRNYKIHHFLRKENEAISSTAQTQTHTHIHPYRDHRRFEPQMKMLQIIIAYSVAEILDCFQSSPSNYYYPLALL